MLNRDQVFVMLAGKVLKEQKTTSDKRLFEVK